MRNSLSLDKVKFVGRIVTHQGRTKTLSISSNRWAYLVNSYEIFFIHIYML